MARLVRIEVLDNYKDYQMISFANREESRIYTKIGFDNERYNFFVLEDRSIDHMLIYSRGNFYAGEIGIPLSPGGPYDYSCIQVAGDRPQVIIRRRNV